MELNSLYITISLPRLPPYHPLSADHYRPYLTTSFDPKTYETAIATSNNDEEFSWGVYWVDAYGDGTLYSLDHLPEPHDETYHTLRMFSRPPHDIIFEPTLICILKLITIPSSLPHEMETYLLWLTRITAPSAARSFIWATTTYARCRKHIVHTVIGEDESESFEINGFLEEALGYAYRDVRHALMGRGVVPVWTSKYGVEVIDDEEDEEDHGWLNEEDFGQAEQEEHKEDVVDFETAWPRLSDVYSG